MYYRRTRNAPLINEPTFCDIEIQEGIGSINTTTENDTQDGKYASNDEEYANMPGLTVKPKIERDSDDKSDDKENNDDENEKLSPRQNKIPVTRTLSFRVTSKP